MSDETIHLVVHAGGATNLDTGETIEAVHIDAMVRLYGRCALTGLVGALADTETAVHPLDWSNRRDAKLDLAELEALHQAELVRGRS